MKMSKTSRRQLLLQGRQCGTYRGQVRLLLKNIGAGLAAQFELALNDGELLFFECNDFRRGCELIAHRSQLDRRRGDIGGQREIARLELEVLGHGLRLQSFESAPSFAR